MGIRHLAKWLLRDGDGRMVFKQFVVRVLKSEQDVAAVRSVVERSWPRFKRT
jgi:hypothetical protein